MNTQATHADTGFRDHRIEFVREDEPGVTPQDPDWQLFSDTLETAFVWEADAQIEAQRGLGDYQVQNHFTGAEDHSASIEYHLQRFFVDGDGNPLDPAGDAILRGPEGGVRNTHTVVDRADFDGERTYVVARGCYPNLGDLSGDPGTALPMVATLEYEAKSVRMYRVTQPAGDTLSVSSTSAEDTTQTLTVESDDGSMSEELTLDGTTSVSTAESFDSLDAFELDAPTDGEVVIENSSGDVLARIRGAEAYDGATGDIGVPTLGSGSHADPIGSSYETFLDDYISKGGAQLAAEVRSASMAVDNGYSKDPVMGTAEQAIHIGQQEAEFSATVAGDFAGHEALTEHLTGTEFDLVWEMDGGDVILKNAVLMEPGEVGPEAGDVVSTIENTFDPKGIELAPN
jgi:hypothetical protein